MPRRATFQAASAVPWHPPGRVRPGCLSVGLVPGARTGFCVVDPGLAVDRVYRAPDPPRSPDPPQSFFRPPHHGPGRFYHVTQGPRAPAGAPRDRGGQGGQRGDKGGIGRGRGLITWSLRAAGGALSAAATSSNLGIPLSFRVIVYKEQAPITGQLHNGLHNSSDAVRGATAYLGSVGEIWAISRNRKRCNGRSRGGVGVAQLTDLAVRPGSTARPQDLGPYLWGSR